MNPTLFFFLIWAALIGLGLSLWAAFHQREIDVEDEYKLVKEYAKKPPKKRKGGSGWGLLAFIVVVLLICIKGCN
jgi:hypothetical protein